MADTTTSNMRVHRVDAVDMENVTQAIGRVRDAALERNDPWVDDGMFVVGRAMTVDQLLDEVMAMPNPDGLGWEPETSEVLIRAGVKGRWRAAWIVTATSHRGDPPLRGEDLHIFVGDPTVVLAAIQAQPDGSTVLNSIVEKATGTTLVDQGVAEFMDKRPKEPTVDADGEETATITEALAAGRGVLRDLAPSQAIRTDFVPELPTSFKIATWTDGTWTDGGPWSWRATEQVPDGVQRVALSGGGRSHDTREAATAEAKQWIADELEMRRKKKESFQVEEVTFS